MPVYQHIDILSKVSSYKRDHWAHEPQNIYPVVYRKYFQALKSPAVLPNPSIAENVYNYKLTQQTK